MSALSIALDSLTPLRVLLVEDSPADADLIKAVLRPPAFEVISVDRLSEARAALRSKPIDVILLDLTLPDSRGSETLSTVVDQSRGVAIVVITGNDDAQTALDAVAHGAKDYLIKGRASAETIVRSVRYAVERSRTEEELRRSEERFRALVENGSDGVSLVDDKGNILYISPAITRILGYSVDELVGRNVFTFFHPDDMMEARRRFAEILSNGYQLSGEPDLRYRHRDGTWRYLEVFRANHLDNPAVRAIVINFRDVTDRRMALETAEELRRRYEVILNSIGDGIDGLDLEGNIRFENAASVAMLGWEPQELIGKPSHETIHHSHSDGTPYDKKDCPIQATLRDGEVRHVTDDVFWRKDGTFFCVDYVVAPKINGRGEIRGVVIAFRDITRQKEMQRQVDQAVRVASLGRVAASVAHEFNNVLMGIQPFAEILQRKSADIPAFKKPLRHILDGVKRGRLVSYQILRFASPAAPRLTPLNLGAWMRDFSDEARHALRDRTLHLGPTESLIVEADPEQLSQVMLNLVANARDASPAGASVTLSVVRADAVPFLCQRLPEPERFATILVRDRGTGIPQDVLDLNKVVFNTGAHPFKR